MLKGRSSRNITILKYAGRFHSSKEEICNKLAQTLAKISSTVQSTIPISFIAKKRRCEQQNIEMPYYNDHYSKAFQQHELEATLEKLKQTAPGSDNINNQMIQYLPRIAMLYILHIYNKMYKESDHPAR